MKDIKNLNEFTELHNNLNVLKFEWCLCENMQKQLKDKK